MAMILPVPQTTAERALYQARLTAASQALHDLITGQQVRVSVDQNGERVEFTAANSARLQEYISALENALSSATATLRRPKPLRFLF